MVRVQPDMMSAQYITKDGARREVNLIPNAQIEDQLFNQLADKKVTQMKDFFSRLHHLFNSIQLLNFVFSESSGFQCFFTNYQ